MYAGKANQRVRCTKERSTKAYAIPTLRRVGRIVPSVQNEIIVWLQRILAGKADIVFAAVPKSELLHVSEAWKGRYDICVH